MFTAVADLIRYSAIFPQDRKCPFDPNWGGDGEADLSRMAGPALNEVWTRDLAALAGGPPIPMG